MIFKGIRFRHVPAYTYRRTNSLDFYSNGEPMRKPEDTGYYVIPVRIKDCIDGAGDFKDTLREQAKCPLRVAYHSRTDLLCLLPRRKQGGPHMMIGDVWTNDYVEHRYYCVKDGRVYTGIKLRVTTPEELEYIRKKSG